ncbi:hypothetical protein GDO81_000521 [Engystomops pustulosus]|uniref:Peptidase C1A papain C-terminal domain-containing protein n=1 Tax=Engystomops pustulosus TaxID=76066 RepID=A0AAV7D6A8_ENGPU|nr:hypothetical protein GDO81_000521 [Engystomops pustulosus]
MLWMCVLGLVAGHVSSSLQPPYTAVYNESHVTVAPAHNDTFLLFMESFGQKFPAGSRLSRDRYRIFLKSLERQSFLNSITQDAGSAHYGITQFSDLSVEEFTNIYLRSNPYNDQDNYVPYEKVDEGIPLPLRFDWRDKNLVTGVKNQLDCGACWAFSIVGAIESAYAIKGNVLEDLSVQQVIDCSYLDKGCDGGSTDSALKWLNQVVTPFFVDFSYMHVLIYDWFL